MTTREIIDRWVARRAELELLGANVDGAKLCDQAIADLKRIASGDSDELLNLRAAADASGYSTRQLKRLIDEEKIANHGRKGSPRVRRGDLPKKVELIRKSTGEDSKASTTMLGISRSAVAARSRQMRGVHR